jgi:hypothetical protein
MEIFNYIKNRYYIKKINKDVNYFLNYPKFLLKFYLKTKVTSKIIKINSQIIYKICDNYIYQCKQNISKGKNTWSYINDKNKHLHKIFKEKKAIFALSNPDKNNLFLGLDPNSLENHNQLSDYYLYISTYLIINKILIFAEYLGIVHGFNPIKIHHHIREPYPHILRLILLIEKKINLKLYFKNPFPGERGIETSRGVITSNEIDSLFDAWKIKQIVNKNESLLEVGGGLGRTAYYCFLFGIRDISIVDIPMSNLIQANYLFRIMENKNDIILENELINSKKTRSVNNKIKLISPNYFLIVKKNIN